MSALSKTISPSFVLSRRQWYLLTTLLSLSIGLHGCASAQPVNWGPAEPQPFFPAIDKANEALYHNSTKAPNTLALAADGKALLPIVIAPNASVDVQATANELATYLKQITDATFDVKTGDGSSGIVLGKLGDFPPPNGAPASLAPALALHGHYEGREAYAIRTGGKRLLLLGATDLGATHAAFRFLELIGCRWFFPGKNWEVVPSQPALSFGLNETDRPAVLSRNIWWSFGSIPESGKEPAQWRAIMEYKAWQRHNRMAASFERYLAHAYSAIVTGNKPEFDKHPEYYALLDGKRIGWQMCLSNPAVREMFMKYALDYFKKNPNADMVSFSPNDGPSMCECDECKKLGTISDRVFGLTNQAARLVAKEYPGKMVGVLAYFEQSDPPSFNLEPNVHTQLCNGYTSGRYSFNQQLELWPQHTKNLGFYDYFSTYAWGQDRLRPPPATGPIGNYNYLKTKVPYFLAHGLYSFDAESSNCWGQYGRGYYVANKLMWNPKADVDALLADFYEKAFGPAAPAMRRYYERLDPANKPLFSKDLLARAYRDVAEASALATGRPDVQARLDDIKGYLRYNQLYWKYLDPAADKAQKKQAMLALLTQAYRTRYSYMQHSGAMITDATRGAAEEFDQPTWSYWNPSPDKPWKVETPYTHEETEREFQEGLQFFQPQNVEEKKFSNDLVPVRFRSLKPPALAPYFKGMASSQFFGALGRYALYSLRGEPLELDFNKADIPGAGFSLLDANEKVIEPGTIRPVAESMIGQNKVQKFRFNVPKAGLYYFDVHSTSWGVGFGAKQPAAIVLPRDGNVDSYVWGGTPMFFYVPKGTQQIQYYWSGYPHKIYNPSNEVALDSKTNNEYITISVPEGMDGRLWSVATRLGNMWLFNCPNLVAATPDALLVPREVAEQDELEIRQ